MRNGEFESLEEYEAYLAEDAEEQMKASDSAAAAADAEARTQAEHDAALEGGLLVEVRMLEVVNFVAGIRDTLEAEWGKAFRRLGGDPTLVVGNSFYRDGQTFKDLVIIHDIQCRKFKYWFSQTRKTIEREKVKA